MGLTIQITDETVPNAYDVTYSELELGNYDINGIGRYALSIDGGTRRRDLKKFRTPGIDGQYVVRCGIINSNIAIAVRYVAPTLADAETAYESDFQLFGQSAASVISMARFWEGCNLITDSVSRSTPIRNTGREYLGTYTQVYFDVTFAMSEDRPT